MLHLFYFASCNSSVFCVFDVLPMYVVFLRFSSHFFVLRPFFVFILREVIRDVATSCFAY